MVDLAKLKVCFLAGCLGQGGAERQLYYMLRALQSVGVQPQLLSLTRGEFWEEKIRQLDVPVTWVGRRRSKLARLAHILAVARGLRPDIIQSQHFFTNLYVVGAARILGIRAIGAIRNNVISEVRSNGRFLGRWSIRAPGCLAANSRQAISNAIDMGVSASRLNYLPNSVDTDAFRPLHSKQPEAEGRVMHLLCVGRLVAQKRVDLFLQAISRLRGTSETRVKATVVGDGPERDRLESQAADLRLLPDVVEFRGAVSNMVPVYHEANILVLTSDWEGTPNVLLEAMACGLPVVATRVGGVPEIIQDEVTGLLVEPGDVDAFADRLTRLCDSAILRTELGGRARQYVLQNHSCDRLAHCLESLYKATLSQ